MGSESGAGMVMRMVRAASGRVRAASPIGASPSVPPVVVAEPDQVALHRVAPRPVPGEIRGVAWRVTELEPLGDTEQHGVAVVGVERKGCRFRDG